MRNIFRVKKPSKGDINLLYLALRNSVDLRRSSVKNEEQREKARTILDDVVSIASQFSLTELTAIVQLARHALADAVNFDEMGKELKLSDVGMKALQEKLEKLEKLEKMK